MEEIVGALLQLAKVIGVPVLASLALWGANELYYRAFGPYRYKAILLSGSVGTPVHELSHAITAMAFGMKVTGIRFYYPDPQSQTLGYVSYRYNPYNFVHSLGIFFTGIAPLIAASYLVYAAFYLSGLPNLHEYLILSSDEALMHSGTVNVVGQWSADLLGKTNSWQTILVLVVAMMLGLHSTPSGADLRGSMRGAFAVLVVIAAYWGVLKLLPMLPDILMVKSVEWLNHLGTAIFQLALLSILGAMVMTVVGGAVSLYTRYRNKPLDPASQVPDNS
ncbi:hypothetical protein LWH94_09845 [Marinobacter sp. G11]|uniref:hypothetical protein n=1 Tax=Marinobacter sp. G11 TaxID=2903522 RepID=UPI001E564646|nr:hypothetical protein [Marinobacter sp. G11]MCE0759505.1 hypothetical protein [Marinobacter sp. G11]